MNALALMEAIQEHRDRGVAVALVTVVATKGSTPREEGAKMAILPNGSAIGTIGGGCVEGKIRSTALRVLIREKTSRTVVAELNEEIGSEQGDVCGGTMSVLIEYLPPAKRKAQSAERRAHSA